MNKVFKKLGDIIEKSPFKVLFISLAVVAIMITGALNVNMATGNETLVKSDSEAFISNYQMEKEFGGDAIMVLLNGDKQDLLSQDNLEKMWNVEERLKYNKDIYSFLSPASIVHQITQKQASELKNKLPEISDGLEEMSQKLIEIGNELGSQTMPDPVEIEKKLDNLMANMNPDLLMDQMLNDSAAEMAKLGSKVKEMSLGLNQMGSKLSEIGKSLGQLNIGDTSNLELVLGDLENVAKNFDQLIIGQNKLSDGLSQFDNVSADLKLIPKSTAEGLSSIQSELASKLAVIKDNFSAPIDKNQITEMSQGLTVMGDQLTTISKNIENLPKEMSLMTSGLQDPSHLFSTIMSDVESEVLEMKASLTTGLDPEKFKTMSAGFVTMGENLSEVSSGLEMFSDKSQMMKANIPHNQSEVDFILYDDNNNLKEIFTDTVVDEEHIMMVIKLKGNIEDSDKDEVFNQVTLAMEAEYLDSGDDKIDYIISGKPVLDASLRAEMQTNMKYMVIAATLVMTAVLFFVFKVRWSILSIGIILVSVIGTLGLMGHLSFSMTMVSMAVFPILIGLGIDFSIQFHNRYEEERSVTKSLTNTGRAIAIAVFASMLGFISLYASPVPMIQDFGKMLTIGVVVSFLGSVFILMPILQIRDMYNPKGKDSKEIVYNNNSDDGGFLGRILGSIAKFVSRFAPMDVLFAIAIAGFGMYADSKVGVETNIESFMPQDMEALEDIRYVRDIVGSTDQMVIYMEDDNILSESNLTWIKEMVLYIETTYDDQTEDVKSIDNLVLNLTSGEDLTYSEYIDVIEDLPKSQSSMFVSENKDKGAIIINIKHMATEELQDFVQALNKDLANAPIKVTVTGKSVLDVEMVEGLTAGRVKMTLIGIALVYFGLLLVYKNPFKALIPVLPVLLIVGMSGGIMNLLGFSYTPITATLGALILGMGTETTLMILERYVEERENGSSKALALDTTVRRIGKATLSTELTTMGGFAVLTFSSFVILRDFGFMTVINVSLVLISTFVVLPAVIWIFDRFIIKE